MSTMIQIRNVPPALHRKLKARAAMEGISMSEYVLREVKKSLEHPARQELLDRIASLPPADLRPSPAEILREERNAR